jgi:hypothetical protein
MVKILGYPGLDLIHQLPIPLDHVAKLLHQLANLTDFLLYGPQLSQCCCRVLRTGLLHSSCCARIMVRTEFMGRLIIASEPVRRQIHLMGKLSVGGVG